MATGSLQYGVYTKNLIEIAFTYAALVSKYSELSLIDSIVWKQQFVTWANEFEEKYSESGYWESNEYLDYIDAFVKERILEFAGLQEQEGLNECSRS